MEVYKFGQAILENVSTMFQLSNKYDNGMDPISTCIRLALLKFKPVGTKLRFKGPIIEFNDPSILQGGIRNLERAKRDNLNRLMSPINQLTQWYNTNDPKLQCFMKLAVIGLENLKTTYAQHLVDNTDTPIACYSIEHFIEGIKKNFSDEKEVKDQGIKDQQIKDSQITNIHSWTTKPEIPKQFVDLWTPELLNAVYYLVMTIDQAYECKTSVSNLMHMQACLESVERILQSQDQILLNASSCQ